MRVAKFSSHFVLGVFLGFGVSGCGSLPIPANSLEQTNSEWIWTDLEEVSTLKTLYDYAQTVDALTAEERTQEFRRLNQQEPNVDELVGQNPLRRLRIALLLSQPGSEISNYDSAIDTLRSVYEQVAHQPLLSSFVLQQIHSVEQSQRLDTVLKQTRQRYRRLRAAYRTLRQQPTPATVLTPSVAQDPDSDAAKQNPQISTPTTNSSSSSEVASAAAFARQQRELEWELDRLENELAELQRLLQNRDNTIAEQNDKIQELEAKITALSAIELNLNNQ